jgi:16S rRNA (cytosine967-C5)-methyltransferase
MKIGAYLQAAIDLLDEIGERAAQGHPADEVTNRFFRNRRFMGPKDRKAVSEIVFGILRYRAALDWWHGSPNVGNKFRVLAWMILQHQWEKPQIQENFNGHTYHPRNLRSSEWSLVEKLIGQELIHPDMPAITALNVPSWVYDKVAEFYGDKTNNHLKAYLKDAPLDIRVNTLKATREQAEEALKQEGISFTQTPTSLTGLRLGRGQSLSQTKPFKDGWVDIQDESSQLAALIINAKPGENVLDLCAGAGGKTLALAATMENKGRLVATDVHANRLKRAGERLRRAGAHNVTCKTLDAKGKSWLKRQGAAFDCVLVDAPCTGSGTWRRNPDLKWRMTLADLVELQYKQRGLLDQAAKHVKSGGRLIYMTCSILKDENEDNAHFFLESHSDFLLKEEQRFSALESNTDGFYIAVFTKK